MDLTAKVISVPANDDFPLSTTQYVPRSSNGCCVIVNSATAVRQSYYNAFARFLCAHGFTVVTYDYRGIGESLTSDIRTFAGTMLDWGARDFSGLLNAVSSMGFERIFVVGHSVGGQLVGLAANNSQLAGVVSVGAQSGYWRYWQGPRRYALAALWYGLMPGLCSVLSYFPAQALGLGEDLPAGVATQWARWCRHESFIVDDDGRPIREHFERFERPILAYSFADDPMAPKPAVDSLCSYFKSAPIERRHLQPRDLGAKRVGHFGFFRSQFATTLWQQTLDWLSAQRNLSAVSPRHACAVKDIRHG